MTGWRGVEGENMEGKDVEYVRRGVEGENVEGKMWRMWRRDGGENEWRDRRGGGKGECGDGVEEKVSGGRDSGRKDRVEGENVEEGKALRRWRLSGGEVEV